MAPRRTRPFGAGGPLTYGIALVVVALTVGPVLYGARRTNGARTWVLVVRSAAEAEPLMARLAGLDRDVDGVVR